MNKNFYTRHKKFYNQTLFLNGPLSIFLNPSFFARRGIFKKILKNKEYIRGSVLDFGCGRKPYKEIFTFDSYIGIDVDASAYPHGDAADVSYDGTLLPFEDEKFDSIFSTQVFEHVRDIDLSLKEMFRVLRPGGYLLLTMPFVWEEHEIPNDFRRFTSYGIIDLLIKHNFSILKVEKTNTYIEAISQVIMTYIAGFMPGNRFLKTLFSLGIIAPMNIVLYTLSVILPQRDTFFNDLLCVAQKPLS